MAIEADWQQLREREQPQCSHGTRSQYPSRDHDWYPDVYQRAGANSSRPFASHEHYDGGTLRRYLASIGQQERTRD